MPPPDEDAPPPLSRLEELVLEADIRIHGLGFDATCDLYRERLRDAIAKKLRELAKTERVEVACRVCGEVIERSPSHAERALAGRVPLPLCEACRWPERSAREDDEAARFVASLGAQAREFAGAVAALRIGCRDL